MKLFLTAMGLATLVAGLSLVIYLSQDPCDNVVLDLVDSERYVGNWAVAREEENMLVANQLMPGCAEIRIDLVRTYDSGGARIRFSSDLGKVEADLFDLELATFSGKLEFARRPWFIAEAVQAKGASMEIGRCLLTSTFDQLRLWLDVGAEYRKAVIFKRS